MLLYKHLRTFHPNNATVQLFGYGIHLLHLMLGPSSDFLLNFNANSSMNIWGMCDLIEAWDRLCLCPWVI